MDSNSLYYGDNLDILRRYVQDESADLIYLDPPFNSNQTYNILFQEKDGTQSASQIKAFGDTWHWDETAARSYEETVEAGGQVSEAMQAFRKLLGTNDMLAYMSMMAPQKHWRAKYSLVRQRTSLVRGARRQVHRSQGQRARSPGGHRSVDELDPALST